MIIVYHPSHFYPQTTIITFHLVTMDRTLKLLHAEIVNFIQVRFCESRLRFKCDGTCRETRFRLSTKRTSPFQSAGASVQSTTGRRAVRISMQGLYCSCKPVFCSHVTLTGYPLPSLVSPSLLLPCVTVCHHVSNAVYKRNLQRPVCSTSSLHGKHLPFQRSFFIHIIVDPPRQAMHV
jgi:hypothetical protein